MGFLPPGFEVPALLETDRFRLRPLTVHDVVKDYDAVMTSREHLWRQFGQAWGWPPADLTLEQDLIDLGWHQKEFQRRSSFDDAVMSLDEARLLGCVYVDPPEKAGYDAEVCLWVRASELAVRPGGLPRPGAGLGPVRRPAGPVARQPGRLGANRLLSACPTRPSGGQRITKNAPASWLQDSWSRRFRAAPAESKERSRCIVQDDWP
jgi:hypothetical protein